MKEKNLRFCFKIFGSVFRPRFSPVSVRFKKFGLNRISVFFGKNSRFKPNRPVRFGFLTLVKTNTCTRLRQDYGHQKR